MRPASTHAPKKKPMKKKLLVALLVLLLIPVAGGILFMRLAPTQQAQLLHTLPPAASGLSQRQVELLAAPPLPAHARISSLVVRKGLREMMAYDASGQLLKTYPIALGGNPIGHKQFEGDRRTPEGLYRINDRNPNSRYHLNLGVSYPNAADRRHAAALGKPPGGDIKIHGLPNGMGEWGASHLLRDWTDGCIAVTNPEMNELFRAVVHNAEIEILP